jgi:hypothetical protein
MFKFSLKKGRPVALVNDGSGRVICIDKEGDMDAINTPQELVPIMNLCDNKTDRVFICGKSGSGKTYLGNSLVREKLRLFPEKSLYVFSPYQEDESFDYGLETKIQRLDVEGEYEVEDFKDSVVVFDDCNLLTNAKTLKKMYTLVKGLMSGGRHHATDVFWLSHTLMDGVNTKYIIGAANYIVIYPQDGAGRQKENFLKVYGGLASDQIDDILSTDERWVMIHNEYPMFIQTEHEVKFPISKYSKKK